MCDDMEEDVLEASLRQTVRAQYHLRASEQGLLAWDVRRLARLPSSIRCTGTAITPPVPRCAAWWRIASS